MSLSVEKQHLVILASGSASTGYEIHSATQPQDGRLARTKVAGLILSNYQAGGYFIRNELQLPGVPVRIVDPKDFKNGGYGVALARAIHEFHPDLVGQYGHSPRTPNETLTTINYADWINQHGAPVDPSPYDFGGNYMSCPQRFLATRLMFVREAVRVGNYWNDATAQRVSPEFDKGRVLKRGRVEILPTDIVATLQARNIIVERRVQIEALQDFENDTVTELPPYQDLVLPSEKPLLLFAKDIARAKFGPEGNEIATPNYSRALNRNKNFGEEDLKRMISHLQPQA